MSPPLGILFRPCRLSERPKQASIALKAGLSPPDDSVLSLKVWMVVSVSNSFMQQIFMRTHSSGQASYHLLSWSLHSGQRDSWELDLIWGTRRAAWRRWHLSLEQLGGETEIGKSAPGRRNSMCKEPEVERECGFGDESKSSGDILKCQCFPGKGVISCPCWETSLCNISFNLSDSSRRKDHYSVL